MFKKASFEEEIYSSMEKQLVSNQLEDKHGFSKMAKAIDCLNAAAEIFEQAGMPKQTAEITEVLHGLVEKLSSKTSSILSTASAPSKRSFSIVNDFGELNHFRAAPADNGMWQMFVSLEDNYGKYEEEQGQLVSDEKLLEMFRYAYSHHHECERAAKKLKKMQEEAKDRANKFRKMKEEGKLQDQRPK